MATRKRKISEGISEGIADFDGATLEDADKALDTALKTPTEPLLKHDPKTAAMAALVEMAKKRAAADGDR